jgi:hypothetical protein
VALLDKTKEEEEKICLLRKPLLNKLDRLERTLVNLSEHAGRRSEIR